MVNWDVDYRKLRPPEDQLALCTRVELDGEGKSMLEMRSWCHEHADSVVWAERIDMSDLSSWTGPDDYVQFYFIHATDATMFALKFK